MTEAPTHVNSSDTSSSPASSKPLRLAIIGGESSLPLSLRRAALENGHDAVVYGVEGLFSPAEQADWMVGFGQLGRLRRKLDEEDRRNIVFAGRFHRPDYAAISWDAGALTVLPKILRTGVGGDDAAVRIVARIFGDWGITLLGPTDIAPQFLLTAKAVSKKKPGKEAVTAIDVGRSAIEGLSVHDVGQSVIVHKRRILAVEAAEGTDAMIERVATLRETGRVTSKVPSGVLVKMPKRGQEMRLDMPVAGLETVAAASKAGLEGIALASSGVLVPEINEVIAEVNSKGMFLVGFDVDAESSG